MSRVRKRALAIGTALAVLAVVGLWLLNTRSLEFPYQDDVPTLAPGESITIESDRPCVPNSVIRYEPSFFGRWRQTHVNGRPDIVRWYDIGSRSYSSIEPCIDGPWVVTAPQDAPDGRIALCDFTSERECVQIRVEQAD